MEYSVDDNNVSQKASDEHRDSLDHLATDATDDEQEDLPYDGILECYLVPSLHHGKVDKSSTPFDLYQAMVSLEESPPSNSPIQSETTNDEALYFLDSSDLFSLSETVSSHTTQANEDIEQESKKLLNIPTIIPDVLLRHITKDNLVNPSEFIDYETIPEISIVESSDETAISRKSNTKFKQCPYDEEQEDFKEEYLEMYRKENSGIQENMMKESNSDIDEISTKGNDEENEFDLIQENVHDVPPDDVDKESKQPIYEPQRRPSYEMKYGQGQVHYKLPDFSKVLPKVKIPKGDNRVAKPVHATRKAATSTSLIEQSFLIQDILDSMQPFMPPGQMKEDTLFLDQRREQALVDSDLVKTVPPPALECSPLNPCQFLTHVEDQSEVVYLGLQANGLEISSSKEAVIEKPQNMECARVLTEGEKMTRLLMEQSQRLKIKVESFSDSLFKKSLPRKEQLLAFQSLKSCLETLEIDYLSTKEKHRDLQLQVYRTGNQTVVEFDIERHPFYEPMPRIELHSLDETAVTLYKEFNVKMSTKGVNYVAEPEIDGARERPMQHMIISVKSASPAAPPRQLEVEGQIFRLGMLLEEIQEQINKSEENETESTSLTTSGEAPVLSHIQTEDVNDLVTNNTDKVIAWSSNTTKVSETQVQQDSPVETEEIDSLHPLCLHPKTSTGIIDHGLDPVLHDHSTVTSVNQLAKKEATVIPDDIVPLVLGGQLCNPKGENSFSQMECPEDWILAEHSGFVEENQITGKLKKDIAECPLHLRYQEDKIRKTQTSSSSLWKKYSNGKVPTAESHGKLLNPEKVRNEYPNQKPLWLSKLPLCVQNHSLSNRLHHIRSNISHCMPSSRSSEQSSVSHHSQVANSTISTSQGKRWKKVKPNNLDYKDNKILNYVLDNALRTAKNMQKTTERMVQRLATDLVNPTFYRSSYTV